ncbi:MAG: dTMP kinase [Chloroflexia bacterium]|nr:dTMP kinase [Chloroflexia bacterium]
MWKSRGVLTANALAGCFISLEGTEGSGKTTIAQWIAAELRARGASAIVTREPGGTAIGEEIRSVLLGAASGTMVPETEMLLFAAARAQHVKEFIQPALKRGLVVITDRFTDSSLAYQSGGRGLPMEDVAAAQLLAVGNLHPDVTVLLDLPVTVGLERRFSSDDGVNRLDSETVRFHERVRETYLSLAAAEPGRWRIIDASQDQSDVCKEVWMAVSACALPASDHGRQQS